MELEPGGLGEKVSRMMKRPNVEVLLEAAVEGRLPRSRSLKPWEPAKLNPRTLQIVLLRATGLKQRMIAEMMDLDEGHVSVIVNHPDSQYLLTRLIGYAADEVVDIRTRIEAYTGEALDTVVEVMRNTDDDKLRSANAFGILDRHYASAPKGGAAGSGDSVQMPAETMNLLVEALKETREIQDAQYVVVDAQEGADSSASMVPGPSSAGSPPDSGSP